MSDTVSVEREIRSPADELWACVSDVTRMPEWSPESVGATWLDGSVPGTVGGRFKGTNRNGRRTWSTTGTVVTADPGRAFAFRVTSGPLAVADWRYTFEQSGDTTRVVETWTDRRSALTRLLGTIVTGVKDRSTHNRATMVQTLAALQAHAESS